MPIFEQYWQRERSIRYLSCTGDSQIITGSPVVMKLVNFAKNKDAILLYPEAFYRISTAVRKSK